MKGFDSSNPGMRERGSDKSDPYKICVIVLDRERMKDGFSVI